MDVNKNLPKDAGGPEEFVAERLAEGAFDVTKDVTEGAVGAIDHARDIREQHNEDMIKYNQQRIKELNQEEENFPIP